MKVDDERRTAVVATNAHIITCGPRKCSVRVGFGDSFSPDGPTWSDTVDVTSRDTNKDLAFIEVEIPESAEIRAARFAAAECGQVGVERVLSIGWPDLTIREEWGVQPPPNIRDHVKRYSSGLFLLWLEGYRMRPEVKRTMQRLQVVFHNADVLPGSSGGPLINRNGEIIGVNTAVVRDDKLPDHHQFCARRDSHKPGQCVHIAIDSSEVIQQFEQVYSSTISVADCASLVENAPGRRTPELAARPAAVPK